MAVPKYYEMYKSFLKALLDQKEHPFSDVKAQVISDFMLSDEDVAELLPSGRQAVFSNRIGWCRTYLKKAGLIDSPSRAHFVITNNGIDVYRNNEIIDDSVLRQFPSFVDFMDGNTEQGDELKEVAEDSSETPQEILERSYKVLNDVLADELLTKIHQNSPAFFERFVIELMEHMGYGTGKVTQLSRDEGIDGVIYQDKLGFDKIYVQAKRYDLDKVIGRPELQKFSGAIPDNKGKGMFVTTAKYSADAKKYADERGIILIDGKKLAQLMIEYDYGVSTVETYRIKRIDLDVFEEE